MIIGYLGSDQRNISTYEQRDIINQYTYKNMCDVDVFLKTTDKKNDINSKENTLIMANTLGVNEHIDQIFTAKDL